MSRRNPRGKADPWRDTIVRRIPRADCGKALAPVTRRWRVPAPLKGETMAPLVLVVAANDPLAETISCIVQGAGYTPHVALHGRHALEVTRALQPAVLIIDLQLPYLDGAAVIAAVRTAAAVAGTVAPSLILMAASSLDQARAAGADIVLRTPFDVADLEALLWRVHPLEAQGRTSSPRRVSARGGHEPTTDGPRAG